jgi:hypothetical protein
MVVSALRVDDYWMGAMYQTCAKHFIYVSQFITDCRSETLSNLPMRGVKHKEVK